MVVERHYAVEVMLWALRSLVTSRGLRAPQQPQHTSPPSLSAPSSTFSSHRQLGLLIAFLLLFSLPELATVGER